MQDKPVGTMPKSLFIGELDIDELWYRSPRRRRYNPYEPEASLRLFNLNREHFLDIQPRYKTISILRTPDE